MVDFRERPAVRSPGGGWDAAVPERAGAGPPGGDRRTVQPGRPGMARPGQQAERPQPSPPGILTRIWQKNKDLLANAGSLFASTIINSALGFAFWALAAREFTETEVGFGAAAISAMRVLTMIGLFRLRTLFIGKLPKRKSNRRRCASTL